MGDGEVIQVYLAVQLLVTFSPLYDLLHAVLEVTGSVGQAEGHAEPAELAAPAHEGGEGCGCRIQWDVVVAGFEVH